MRKTFPERKSAKSIYLRPSIVAVHCFLLLFGASRAFAASSDSASKGTSEDAPPIILSGLQAYKDKGPDEAVKAWIKGSPIEGSKDALSQSNILRQVQDYYGAYQTFEIVSTRDLSPRVKVFYLTLAFEKGPLFGKFVVYRSTQDWILTSFTFNTNYEVIVPSKP